jgi:hypothetical protein
MKEQDYDEELEDEIAASQRECNDIMYVLLIDID